MKNTLTQTKLYLESLAKYKSRFNEDYDFDSFPKKSCDSLSCLYDEGVQDGMKNLAIELLIDIAKGESKQSRGKKKQEKLFNRKLGRLKKEIPGVSKYLESDYISEEEHAAIDKMVDEYIKNNP